MHLLLDIGGTKLRIAFSKDGKRFAGKPVIANTPENFKTGMALIKKAVAGRPGIKSAICGIAGSFDRNKTKLVSSPNLPGWIGKPIKAELGNITGAPVRLENDADLAGLGEAVFGAGKKDRIVAYLTISTGVGGTRIVDKKIDAGVFGFEPGQQIIDLSKWKPGAPSRSGTLEKFISGADMEKKYGKRPADIKSRSAWEEKARLLAVGLYNTARFWSPDIIILGGSMITKKVGIPLSRVKYHFGKKPSVFSKTLKLTKAKLGEYSGLYGAMALLKQK